MPGLTSHQRHLLINWLPLAFVISALTAMFAVAGQQYIRSQAEVTPAQVSQDLSAQLFKKQSPAISLPTKEVEIDKSTAPFVILYNNKGEPTDGSGKIDGKLPTPPKELFSDTQTNVESRVTWQPKDGTRVAAVMRYYQNDKQIGFVLAGQNMRETEAQQSQLLLVISVGWAVAMTGSLALHLLAARRQTTTAFDAPPNEE